MTVSSTTTKNSYSGNASTTVFAYGFKIFDDDDIIVIIRTDSTGAETTKTKTTHYTVSNVGSASGGNVTFTSGNTPASGETVVLIRNTARTQLTDYTPNDPFPADSHEDALDKLTLITQELEENIGRSLKVSQTNVIATSEFTADATARANKILGFDASGNLQVTTGKVDTVTSSVSAVSAGGTPTASATYTASSGALALAFGLVTGNTGATGNTGSTGAAGVDNGLALTFSNSTSDADPGGGKLAFNNGTISSATVAFIDDADDNGVDISSFAQSWDDAVNSTARGLLLVTKEGTPTTFALFKVSGATTNASGYTKVPITHVVSNGSFSNTDGIRVAFTYSGADGATGSAGSNAGLALTWSNSTSDADPGAGKLAFNNGTVSSVSVIYVDDVDDNSVDISGFVQSWDDVVNSVARGMLLVTKEGTPSTYALFKVTGAVTDASGYNKVAVTHVVSNGTFSNGDGITVQFSYSGVDSTVTIDDVTALAIALG